MVKLLIGIVSGTPYVPLDFVSSIMALDKPVPFGFEFTIGMVTDQARNKIVNSAIHNGCSHILFLDSDMTFPKDIISRLLKHDVDIVGGLYVNRHSPTTVCAFKKVKGNVYKNISSKDFTGLVEIDGIGTGALLIKTEIFDKLKKPYFRYGYDKELDKMITEDMVFCKLAKEKGYKIYCDTDVRCGHLAMQNLLIEGDMNGKQER